MNVQFLERSISPLHRQDSSDEDGEDEMMMNPRQWLDESMSRADLRRSLLPVNLNITRFSLKEGPCAISEADRTKKGDDNIILSSGKKAWEESDAHERTIHWDDPAEQETVPPGHLSVSTTSRTTEAIPILKGSLTKSSSELRLEEGEFIADYRDHCMYTRILNGMTNDHHHESWNQDTIDTIRNIMETRHHAFDQHEIHSSPPHSSFCMGRIPRSPTDSCYSADGESEDGMTPSSLDHRRLPALIHDPVSSLYQVDLDVSARLSLIVQNSLCDRHILHPEHSMPENTTTTSAPLPLYVAFDTDAIHLDEALFEMDDM